MSSDRQLPAAAIDAYQNAFDRVSVRAVAGRLWERHLNQSDQEKLGTSFRDALGKHRSAVGFLLHLNPDLTGEQAVLEVAFAVGLLSDSDREWLMREIVGNEQSVKLRERPKWDRDRSELTFGGKVIRRVRRGVGTNITAILDAFEEHGWPDRIDSPVAALHDDMVHRDAIDSLNKKLTAIQFRSDGTGHGIIWELLPPSTVSTSHRP